MEPKLLIHELIKTVENRNNGRLIKNSLNYCKRSLILVLSELLLYINVKKDSSLVPLLIL